MQLFYTIHTIEPLILSSHTATTQHQCLDYIPGNTLLGALASQHYNKLNETEAFTLFHSGLCRFSPAYPVLDSEIALPMPASWHREKLNPDSLSNHAAADFKRDPRAQYKQCRSGFITSAAKYAEIKMGLTTRTALDATTGRAKEGQLYQYSFIEAGQTFAGWIDCPNEQLAQWIQFALEGELFLGRARSSEFGKVQLNWYTPSQGLPSAQVQGHELVVWCLSDMACLNAMGLPTYTPSASDLHPALQGELDANRSFIRTRKVRRFNRARGGLDSEQLLIAAGSVLTYQLEQTPDTAVLSELMTQGCGLDREQGLGWVLVNPAWAMQSQPNSDKLFQPFAVTDQLVPVSNCIQTSQPSPLLNWLEARCKKESRQGEQKGLLRQTHQAIFHAYQLARRFKGLPSSYIAGPSHTQWRRLAELSRSAIASNWQDKAFKGDAAVCKADNDPMGWGIDWQQNGQHITFAQDMQHILGPLDILALRKLLEDLCRHDPSTSKGLDEYKKFIEKMREEA